MSDWDDGFREVFGMYDKVKEIAIEVGSITAIVLGVYLIVVALG